MRKLSKESKDFFRLGYDGIGSALLQQVVDGGRNEIIISSAESSSSSDTHSQAVKSVPVCFQIYCGRIHIPSPS